MKKNASIRTGAILLHNIEIQTYSRETPRKYFFFSNEKSAFVIDLSVLMQKERKGKMNDEG